MILLVSGFHKIINRKKKIKNSGKRSKGSRIQIQAIGFADLKGGFPREEGTLDFIE
jgi:hypothetical protein